MSRICQLQSHVHAFAPVYGATEHLILLEEAL
jgi:hypothetical protein